MCVFINDWMSDCQSDLQLWGQAHLIILDLTVMTQLFLISEFRTGSCNTALPVVAQRLLTCGSGSGFFPLPTPELAEQ